MSAAEEILALIDGEVADYQAHPLTGDCPGGRAVLAKLQDLQSKASAIWSQAMAEAIEAAGEEDA